MKFSELNLSPKIVRALEELDITEATSIQEKAIPLIQEGKDVIGISRTGSGKTLAFCVPLLEKLEKGKGVQVLILSPTRELAMQISREMSKFGKYMNFSVATVFGGVAIDPQMDQISRSEIVVGTPGRILDHLGRGTLNISNLKTFALDEADKMVEMGFIEDVNRILSNSNTTRQILLFGATISDEVKNIQSRHMSDTVIAKVELQVKEDLLEQFYYNLQHNEKFSYLVHLLKKEETDRVMIFCSTKATVNVLIKNLRNNGIKSEMIHGDLTQNKRMRVIEGFNKGSPRVLVASAVAARGLDIKNVSHVFNYDLPNDPQEYIHRIGRTARAGEAGIAISLLSKKDHDSFGEILRRYRVNIQKLDLEEFERLKFDSSDFGRGRSGFNRGQSGRGRGPRRKGNSNSSSRSYGGRSSGRSSSRSSSNRSSSGSGKSEGFMNRVR
jgi:superfamily II DNA/RNA helicase